MIVSCDAASICCLENTTTPITQHAGGATLSEGGPRYTTRNNWKFSDTLVLVGFDKFREYYKMSQGGFMKNLPREALPNAQEINAEDSVPWYLRYGARVLATLGGLLSILLGALAVPLGAVTLSGSSLASGIVAAVIGVFVTLVEAPFLCSFLSFAQRPGQLLEKNKSPFFKAILYIVLGLIPLLIAVQFALVLSSGLILLAGVIHAVIGFGRKASREEMTAAATGQSPNTMEQGIRAPVY
ncbi:calcium channel flower-like [Varroa jacobsoni]|uniref:Calcium channel flower n=1 Tax=Varroa destructor TaxID=109461 RepID=A0A7M7K5Z9_VARDE|nr:calcium channel flower-like [Varroa destructor]XP_022706747.1 calcium channel flower-like [Varroa jacobsoni]